jgi:response regulator RpfG family c-di-GMP phosphodiesterase
MDVHRMEQEKTTPLSPETVTEADLEADYSGAMFRLIDYFGVTVCSDLHFLVLLAMTIEERSIQWKHRTYQSVRLGLSINLDAGNLVDTKQLTCAILAHDFAMAFLPLRMLDKSVKLDQKDIKLMRTHISTAASLIQRMRGWKEAEEMILAHHEKIDGTGYPNKLRDSEICDGAKILAIVDTFTAQSEKIIHGVMELNRHAGTQFATNWVDHFNIVARKLYAIELSSAI